MVAAFNSGLAVIVDNSSCTHKDNSYHIMAPEKIIPTLFGAQHRAKKLSSALSGAKYNWILYRPVYLGRKSTVQASSGAYIMVAP